jgi:undecaprenyl phosphate-alpha-L-ara4FN deformylase
MRIAFKVDVDTLRGTLEGVPNLLRLFDTYQVQATFLFSLGPDHTGRALQRLLRPGVLGQLRRMGRVRPYDLKTLFYGTLLPGPDIGRLGAVVMRSCRDAGHEVGLRGYDRVKWEGGAAHEGRDWTRRELDKAAAAYAGVFGDRPLVHGAAGWQVNPHALAWEGERGLTYASDTRGRSAFYPMLQGVRSSCPQIPTTLPTLDELMGCDGVTLDNVHQYLYAESQYVLPQGHVFRLSAELEGMALLPVLEKLLVMWGAASGGIRTLGDVHQSLELGRLPLHQIGWGQVPGRPGYLAMQGRVLPAF